MSALQKAIEVCGSQVELARRLGGNIRTGHIYYWLRNALPEDMAPRIETAVASAVTCEQLRPDVKWVRDGKGQVTGYHTPVESPKRRRAA